MLGGAAVQGASSSLPNICPTDVPCNKNVRVNNNGVATLQIFGRTRALAPYKSQFREDESPFFLSANLTQIGTFRFRKNEKFARRYSLRLRDTCLLGGNRKFESLAEKHNGCVEHHLGDGFQLSSEDVQISLRFSDDYHVQKQAFSSLDGRHSRGEQHRRGDVKASTSKRSKGASSRITTATGLARSQQSRSKENAEKVKEDFRDGTGSWPPEQHRKIVVFEKGRELSSTIAESRLDRPSSVGEFLNRLQRRNQLRSPVIRNIYRVIRKDRQVGSVILQESSDWIRKVAGPYVRDVLELRAMENPEAKPVPKPVPPHSSSYRGFTPIEIVQADILYITQVLETISSFFSSWKIPLQMEYDPEGVAAYFVRRPHLLLVRLVQISAAVLSVGFSLLRDNAALRNAERNGWYVANDKISRRRAATAVRLKNALVRLGPTFIKVAQSLSARPDLIGPETAQVLAELQDRLPPFSTEEAMAVLEEELGFPAQHLFPELSETPVAAASFGQVYKGRTADGQQVAVKVQRPRVLLYVARDILILRFLLGVLRKVARINSDLRVLADELGRGLYAELDYRLEARNALEFAMAHSHLPLMVVPTVRADLTSRRVMTMEWLEGERVSDLLAVLQAPADEVDELQRGEAESKLLHMVEVGVESSLVQLLDTGVMHADPHPGNFLVMPQGSVAYLDFGLLCHMAPQHSAAMLAAIAHLVNAEWALLTEDLAALDVLKPKTNRGDISKALEEALGTGPSAVVRDGIPDIRFGQVTSKLWKIALKFRFRLPPYYTLVLRSLASLEGIGLAVDTDFKVFAYAYPYVLRRLLTNNSPSSRSVLRQLLVTDEGRFRWARLAAFAKSGNLEISAGEKGESKPEDATSEVEGRSFEQAVFLANVLLSRSCSNARRIILESDLTDLTETIISASVAPLRWCLAGLLSKVMVRAVCSRMTEAFSISAPTNAASAATSSVSPAGLKGKAATGHPGVGMNALAGSESKAQFADDGAQGSVNKGGGHRKPSLAGGVLPLPPANPHIQKKRMLFLLSTALNRLRCGPLLRLKLLFTALGVVAIALAMAAKQLIQSLIESILDKARALHPSKNGASMNHPLHFTGAAQRAAP